MKSPALLLLAISFTLAVDLCSKSVLNEGCWPIEYTCDATSRPEPNPQVSWEGAGNAKSWILMMDDPVTDAGQTGAYYIHWIVKDIPIGTTSIARGASNTAGVGGTEVKTYSGPCGGPNNKYRITVYAMPNEKTTYDFTNKRGNVIDTDLRAQAVGVAKMRVTNYRTTPRPPCPDTGDQPCALGSSGSAVTVVFALVLALVSLVF